MSYFGWLEKFNKADFSFEDFLTAFSEGKTKYGGWPYHVSSWLEGAGAVRNGLLVIRYEDLLSTPIDTLTTTRDFLGLSTSGEAIQAIVEGQRFRKYEEEGRFGGKHDAVSEFTGRYSVHQSGAHWSVEGRPFVR